MAYVNIVTSERRWILERLVKELGSRVLCVAFGSGFDARTDLQYNVVYSTWRGNRSPIEVSYFAHMEPDEQASVQFFNATRKTDCCVFHSTRYESLLREGGVDNVTTISPGIDGERLAPVIKIGIVGQTVHTGRKGEALVQQMMDLPGIEWHFTGAGRPGPAQHVPEDKLAQFYNALDNILVPALYEGGPMCVAEAMACGVPVIASGLDWVPEFPHTASKTGDATETFAAFWRNSLRSAMCCARQ